MTEVDASVLCTSSSVDCTHRYSDYVSGDECAGTTLQEAEAAGVEVPQEHVAEIHGTSDYGHGCGFNIYQIGGQWWIAHG